MQANPLSSSVPLIYMNKLMVEHPASIQKLIPILFPQAFLAEKQTSQALPQTLDTYVLLCLCNYAESDQVILPFCLQKVRHFLSTSTLNSKTSIVVILYRALKVNFPERKLRREKFMSDLYAAEMLQQQFPKEKNRIHIINEFGPYNVQDSLTYLTGKTLYIDVLATGEEGLLK